MGEPCKLNIIFDIDETLVYFIHSRYVPDTWNTLDENVKNKYTFEQKKFSGHVTLLRPGLLEFLNNLKNMDCELYLWTWSDIEYAEGIADMITKQYNTTYSKDDNNILFKFIFADQHAEASSTKHANSKDLNWLWHDKDYNTPPKCFPAWQSTQCGIKCFAECNTILIDDLPANSVNNSNIHNSITVKPFAPFGTNKDRNQTHISMDKENVLLGEVLPIIIAAKELAKGCYEREENEEGETLRLRENYIFANFQTEPSLQKYLKHVMQQVKKRG